MYINCRDLFCFANTNRLCWVTTPCTAHYAPSVASDVRVAPSVASDVRIAQRSILNRLVLKAARQSLFLINLDCFFARERYCCEVRVVFAHIYACALAACRNGRRFRGVAFTTPKEVVRRRGRLQNVWQHQFKIFSCNLFMYEIIIQRMRCHTNNARLPPARFVPSPAYPTWLAPSH